MRASSPLKPRNLTLTNIKHVVFASPLLRDSAAGNCFLNFWVGTVYYCAAELRPMRFDRTSLNQDVPGGHFLIGLIRAERFLAATLVLA